MKTRATALALILLTGSAAHAQQVVPVAEEPMHRLMLDTETFQVLDPLVLPGDTTLFHLHDVPIHYVMISPSPANAQVLGQPWPEAGIVEQLSREVGDGWWMLEYREHPVVHRVTNTGDRPFRLIGVTNRTGGEPEGVVGASPADLPGTLEADSPWFRRVRLTVTPDPPALVPNGADPVVAIQVSPGAVSATSSPPGSSPGSTTALGEWIVLEPGVDYALRATSAAEVTVVLVQVLVE
jgi:hypothetical protein